MRKILLFVMGCAALNAAEPVNLLQNLNGSFREVYSTRKTDALKKLPVIIIAKGDTLILYGKGTRTEVKYLPSLYHRYKEVSHIPVLLYLSLKDEMELSEAQLVRMNEIKNSIISIQPYFIGDESKIILESCLAFIDVVTKDKKIDSEKQLAFFRDLGPLLLKNASHTSFLQLDALNDQVQAWKKMFPREEWNRVAVVVMGPQMPRVGEVTMQYFSRLTGKSLEKPKAGGDWLKQAQPSVDDPDKKNRRLVYAEGLNTEEEALNLLATHILDEDVGFVFFEDEIRMQCDLLSEGASKRLKEKCEQGHKDSIDAPSSK